MKTRRYALALSALALAAASFAANADILFQNLGTTAPPANVGGHTMTPFNQAAQSAIPNFTYVSAIPGSPVTGQLGVSPELLRVELGDGWMTWGHGYSGPIFYSETNRTVTLTLPPNARAFYFYALPGRFGTWNVSATTNSGTTSGAIAVVSSPDNEVNASHGFGFYSTAGESISSITVSVADGEDSFGIGLAEFGISGAVKTTCASEGYTGTKLIWCKNICENGLTGAALDSWIHRWINRYRDLPYCAQEGGGEEEPPPQQPA